MHKRLLSGLRKGRLRLFTSAAALVLAACGGTPSGAETPTSEAARTDASGQAPVNVRIGLVCNLTALQVVVAMDGGFFAANGINFEKTCFDSGAKAVQALVAGSLDLVSGTYEHVQKLRGQGEDVLAVAGLLNRVGYQLIALKESPVNSLKDLKGRKAAITSPGSLTDMTLRHDLKVAGVDPTRDVQVVGAGIGSTMIAALENKQVDAGMMAEPFLTEMLRSGKYKVIFDNSSYEYAGSVLIVKGGWARNNAAIVKRVIAAIAEGRAASEKDPMVAARAVQKSYDKMDPVVLEEAVRRLLPWAPTDLKVTEKGAAMVVEHLKVNGLLAKEVPYREAVSHDYLPGS